MSKKLLFTISLMMMGMVSTQAWADDGCMSLGSNSDWNVGLVTIHELMQMDAYKDAIGVAQDMSNSICSRSPVLNYITGQLYEKISEKEKALEYYRKAVDFMSEFTVDGKTSNTIWKARHALEITMIEEKPAYVINKEIDFKPYLWTSVGIAGGGLALGAAGAALVLTGDLSSKVTDPGKVSSDKDGKTVIKGQTNKGYLAGWTLMGVGIGMAVAGAVASGVFGYKVANAQPHSQSTVSNLSFGIYPGGAGLEFAF